MHQPDTNFIKFIFYDDKAPKYIYVEIWKDTEHHRLQWVNHRISTQQWINHVFKVTKVNTVIDIRFVENCERFTADIVRSILPTGYVHALVIDGLSEMSTKFMRKMLPLVNNLEIEVNVFNNRAEMQHVLIQNFHMINVKSLPITLDDLLLVNSEVLTVTDSHLTGKDLNRFFKSWIRNRSNPRLKHMMVKLTHKNVHDVLAGINFMETPERLLWDSMPNSMIYIIRNSFAASFQRLDGTWGTVIIWQDADMLAKLSFFVGE